MDRGPPSHISKIMIKYCLPTDLRALPGIGKVSVQNIMNARDKCDNITEEIFLNLNIRNPARLLKYIDFTPFPQNPSAMAKPTGLGGRDDDFLKEELDWEEEEDLSYWEGHQDKYEKPLPYNRDRPGVYQEDFG